MNILVTGATGFLGGWVLSKLSDEFGRDIELIQTEAGVGRSSADILAQEENTGKKIVIENWLNYHILNK